MAPSYLVILAAGSAGVILHEGPDEVTAIKAYDQAVIDNPPIAGTTARVMLVGLKAYTVIEVKSSEVKA